MRGIGSALGIGALVLAHGAVASATTINVNTTNCGFEQAVRAVNDRTIVGGCAAGDGNADKILVPAGTFNIASTGPVQIRRAVQITGAGQSTTTLQCSRVEGQDSSGDQLSAIVADAALASSQTVTISNLTLRGGAGNQVGGLANAGRTGPEMTVNLNGVRVTGFHIAAVSNEHGTMTVNRSVVNDNDVSLDESTTGGITNGGTMTINNSTVDSNVGIKGGGIANSGILSIYASTISNNIDDGSDGGGIFNSGRLSIGHSTISGNQTPGHGGGICTSATSFLSLSFCTIANNSASLGGGVFVDPAAPIDMTDTIVANNSDSAGAAPDVSGNLQSSVSDLIRSSAGVSGGSSIIFGVDPRLGPLTTVDGTPATHALLPGSRAIDAGIADASEFPDNVDERGFPRATDGNGDNVVGYDMGAFEFDPWQSERLLVAAKSSDSHSIVSDPSYSNGQGTWLQSNATNDFVTYKAPLPSAGTYTVKVRLRRGNNRGQFRVQTASNLTGTFTTLGAVQDGFRSSADFVTVTLGNFTVASAGTKYFKFLITGKNAASSGFQLTLDYMQFIRN